MSEKAGAAACLQLCKRYLLFSLELNHGHVAAHLEVRECRALRGCAPLERDDTLRHLRIHLVFRESQEPLFDDVDARFCRQAGRDFRGPRQAARRVAAAACNPPCRAKVAALRGLDRLLFRPRLRVSFLAFRPALTTDLWELDLRANLELCLHQRVLLLEEAHAVVVE